MAKKKQGRTSIRTAAGAAQDRFLDRLQALRDDPLRVLPECPHGEPRPVRRIREGLERLVAGKVGWGARRDKGVLGAVVQSVPMADLDAAPRLLDHKVDGRRRFYLIRGHVEKAAMLGVQNHDDPVVLLMAYRSLAKKEGLHFFAADRLWCTGERPVPPDDWWLALGKRTGIEWQDHRCRTCPHPEEDLVELSFPDGPGLAVCARCAGKAGNINGAIRQMYAGPRERTPLEIHLLRGGVDGERLDLDRELAARYRGGLADESVVLSETLARWRASSDGFTLAGKRYDDQDAFLDALGVEDDLRPAIRVMTAGGHSGPLTNLAGVLRDHTDQLGEAVEVLLPDGKKFARAHKGGPLQVLHAALDESRRRARLDALPHPGSLGRLGTWLDGFARSVHAEGPRGGIEAVRQGLTRNIPHGHLAACLEALGGDLGLEARFEAADREAAQALLPHVQQLLAAEGEAYVPTLDRYLQETGSGERAA